MLLELSSVRALRITGHGTFPPIRSISELCIDGGIRREGTNNFAQDITALQRNYPFMKSLKLTKTHIDEAYLLNSIRTSFSELTSTTVEKITLHHVSLRFKSYERHMNDYGMLFDLFPVARYFDVATWYSFGESDQSIADTIYAFISSYQSSPHNRCALSVDYPGCRGCRYNNMEEGATVTDAATIDQVLGPAIVSAIQRKTAWVHSVKRCNHRSVWSDTYSPYEPDTYVQVNVRLGDKQFDIDLACYAPYA